MRLGFFFTAALLSCSVAAHMPTEIAGQGVIHNADFDEGFTAGSPLPMGSGGDRPSSIDSNLTATVENSTTVPLGTPVVNSSNFARLKESCGEAPSLAFDRGISLGTATSPNAIAHVAVDVLFENIESYQIVFRNGSGSGIPGPASQSIADIDFVPGPVAGIGNAHFRSFGSTTTIAYTASATTHIDAFFDLGNNKWYAFVNGNKIVDGATILDSPLGFVGIGFNFTAFCGPTSTISTVASGLGFPAAVAVHGGFLYVADREAHTVWKINPSTQAKEIVAGKGTGESGYSADGTTATQALLNGPSGVAVDGFGNVFIADTENNIVRKVAGDGTISTVAGIWPTRGSSGNGGPGTAALLAGPRGLALDGAQNLYVVDTLAHQVRKLDTVTGLITAVAGVAGEVGTDDGPVSCAPTDVECTPARLNAPIGVAYGSGAVYIAEEGTGRIRKVVEGQVETYASGLGAPSGVAVDAEGTVYFAEPNHHMVRSDADGPVPFAGMGGLPGFSGDGGSPTAARLNTPVAVAADGTAVYIADLVNKRIRKVVVNATPSEGFNGVMQFDNFRFEQVTAVPTIP